MLKQITTLLLVLFSQVLLAQQPKVETTIDSSEMMIGSQMRMQVAVKHSPETNILIPKSVKLGDKIEVLSQRDSTAKLSSTEILTAKNVTITSFDSGVYTIPPVPIQVEKNGMLDTIFSRAMRLTVVSPTIDSTKDFAPIKDIFQEPLSFQEDILPVASGVFVIFLVGMLIWYYSKRKKEQIIEQKIVKEEPRLPAHVIAFLKLKKLDEQQLWQNADYKAYYSEISYILRDYLENRYEIPALESVTDEILTDLNSFDIENDQTNHLRSILQTADLVKFAKVIPSEEEHRNIMALSLEFIKETKLEEVVELEEDNETTNN